jgi:hypothetical protein
MQCNKFNRIDQIRCIVLQVAALWGRPQKHDNKRKPALHLLYVLKYGSHL